MTIRKHLRKRRKALWLVMGVLIGIGLLIGLAFAISALDGVAGAVGSVATLAVFLGVAYGFGYWSRCPRCQARLGTGMSLSNRARAGPINYCPYCGVSLDEPVDTKFTRAQVSPAHEIPP